MIDGFTCGKKVKPIYDWLQEESPGECHPCLLKPLTEHYMGALTDAGATSQVKKLEEAWNTGEGLTIAKVLDTIKTEVGDTLKNDLETLDCFVQSFKDLAADE